MTDTTTDTAALEVLAVTMLASVDELGVTTLESEDDQERLRELMLGRLEGGSLLPAGMTHARIARALRAACADVARACRLRAEMANLLDRAEAAEEWVRDADLETTTADEMMEAMAAVVSTWDKLLVLAGQWPRSLREVPLVAFARPDSDTRLYVESLRTVMAEAQKQHRENRQRQAEIRRFMRIADGQARRAYLDWHAANHAPRRMCESCGKKEARVDNLCKRCAHAAGVLPHGKIGEEV